MDSGCFSEEPTHLASFRCLAAILPNGKSFDAELARMRNGALWNELPGIVQEQISVLPSKNDDMA
jgi:hypothetical protein